MSFPEYLKERISEDYKNLIIRKLQEIKQQSEQLKSSFHPTLEQIQDTLRESMEMELSRIRESLDTTSKSLQQRISEQLSAVLDEYVSGWYHSDISAFEQQLEILLSDIVSNLPVPPKKANADLESLVNLAQKMEKSHTQSEILNLLLHHIAEWVDRAILFVVKGNLATGWAALGLGHEWDANRVRQIRADLNEGNILREVVSGGEAVFGPAGNYAGNDAFLQLMGDRRPMSLLAFPVLVRGKIAGILYADLDEDISERPDLPNLLWFACRTAGYTIDLLTVKPKGAMEPAKTSVSFAVQPPHLEVAVKEPEPAQAAATIVMPAPQIAPITEEEQKLHDDAKRFARLLVSEIKLYNEAQVAAGRENKDLYERLREDIERSRKMYMDRVPSHIYSSTNYFYEELVRTLANGDASLLGM